jgi:prepilin-type N-terminal cleavage/methylation domain-containing protein
MRKNGFTLIELLLVMAIIGIISAIAIPALLGQRARRNGTYVGGNSNIVSYDNPNVIAKTLNLSVKGMSAEDAFAKVGFPDTKADLGGGLIKYSYNNGKLRSIVAKNGTVISQD